MRCPPWGHVVGAAAPNGGGNGGGGGPTIIRTIRVGFPTETPGSQQYAQLLAKQDPVQQREEQNIYANENRLQRQINDLHVRFAELET